MKKLDKSNDTKINYIKNYFIYIWNALNKKSKKELINRFIATLEITREKNYNIVIKNIKFTNELISKSTNEFLNYLNEKLEKENEKL